MEQRYDMLYEAEVYYDFLKHYEEFGEQDSEQSSREEVCFEYDFTSEKLKQLRTEYHLDEIAGRESDFRKLVNLLCWLNEQLIGNGMCMPHHPMDALTILEKTKTNGIQSNCYTYAVVFHEMCLAMGFYSRMVRCMPCDLHYTDCHCVTTVYLSEFQKWVVFDPANKAYFLNKAMEPMTLMELRKAILDKENVYVPFMGRERTKGLLEYYTKNLVRFECLKKSAYGMEDYEGDKMMYHLQPANFFLRDKTILWRGHHIQYVLTREPEVFWKAPGDMEIACK